MKLSRIAVTLCAYAALFACPATAQCPDGTPPPCVTQRPVPAPNSVAVLYFENVSRDTADDYLADGVTQQVIERLASLERLTVASRFAVGRFRGRAVTEPAAVGRALGVQYLVAGSVQRAGGRVRISAELVRAATGLRTWGETYDRGAGDVLALEDEIAQAVATGIAGRLLPGERSRLTRRATTNAAANDHLLRGDHLTAQRNPLAFRQAVAEYEAAVRLDPRFALAYGRLSYTWWLVLNWGFTYPGLPLDSITARATTAARRALRLDSLSAWPWLVLGELAISEDRTDEGLVLDRHALALAPAEPEVLHTLGAGLVMLGEDAEGMALLARAVAIDPQRAISLTWLGMGALGSGHYDVAARWLDSALAVAPDFYYALTYRAALRIERGDLSGALQDARDASLASRGDTALTHAVLTYLRSRSGDTSAVHEATVLARHGSTGESICFLAAALLYGGNRDGALGVLARRPARFYVTLPMLAPLRGDSAYERFVESAWPLLPHGPKRPNE